MRIAILGSRGYPSTYGGFETFVRRIAPWLADRGHQVTVYSHAAGSESHSTSSGTIQVVGTWGLESKATATITHGLTGAIHARRNRYDAALVLNVANGFALPLIRTATVVNVDGIEWERAKWGRFAKAGFKAGAHATARFATTLVADAEAIATRWQSDFKVKPVFIPYGADVSENVGSDKLDPLGIRPGEYALVVARLVPENNVELFLDAMESLHWRRPAVVVGSSNYPNPIEERLRALQAKQRVTWLGHVDDQELLRQLWANAGVYFHGHSVGGTNPALLQAMGSGAPTVANDTIYNREVLAAPDQVVSPTVDAVAAALSATMADRARQLLLSERGRKTVQERYDWNQVCMSYENALASAAVRYQNK